MYPSEPQNKVTHIAYADDSHHNMGRYRGIGLLTLSIENVERMKATVERILRDSAIIEFKWNELRSVKSRFAAINILDYIVKSAIAQILRVDVLTWDIDDSRHNIQGRSDDRNLRRMYYFLFKNVLAERWPKNCTWKLCIDESSVRPWAHLGYLRESIDWNTGELIAKVNIEEIWAVKSHLEPIIQVADLFAGLGVYSRSSYEEYIKWLNEFTEIPYSKEKSEIQNTLNISARNQERFRVIKHLDEQCKRRRLGVSLKQKGGLRTFNPAKPINFWWYEPQSEYDKAPKW